MNAPTDRKYFVYPFCVDGRKSFNGLCGLVRTELKRDPASGEVFVFLAASMSSIKLLFWDHGGFVIYYKKMDRGRFQMPPLRVDGKGYYISEIQLLQIIRGVAFQKEEPRSPLGRKSLPKLEE